ncbi:MAG TPA: MauE/DoxX family redox-associated membrane protein [Thermoanaerobaculia bacterium]|nr:MauE/DoxX family redox-associated membrane protein [Thermoanaerobaculia bacterium]
MIPLYALVIVTLLARLAGQLGASSLRQWSTATRVGLAAMFCVTAAVHFSSMREDLIRMVPPAVPNPGFMVTFTGICEILGAIGLLVPRTRRIAAIALILLLVAVLPANIHAVNAGVTLRGTPATPILPRVALQVLYISLLWWSSVRKPTSREGFGSNPDAQVTVKP